MLDKNVQKTSTVYLTMTKIIKRVWFDVITNKHLPTTCQLPRAAKSLLPEIKKHTSGLRGIIYLNLRVHGVRYNQCILAAARDA